MGRKTEASPLDALLYHDRTMCIGLVLHLTGRAPAPDRLASHVRDRLDRLPALSVIVSGRGTAATWLRRSPELGYHVRSRDLSVGADIYDVVRELHREPFAEGRPPWTMTILDGHIPGEYLIFYRVSHGVQDIGGITRTLEILFGDTSIDSAGSDAAVRSLAEQARPRLRHYLYAVRLVAGASSKTALWPHPVHGYSGLRSLEWAEVPTNTLRSLAGPHGEALMTPFCPASRGSYRSGRHGITRTPMATKSRFRWRSTTGDPRTSAPRGTISPSGV